MSVDLTETAMYGAARWLLGLLAVYHLATGAVALLAPRLAARFVGAFYGATLGDSPQLRYLTAMVGALAIAVGLLITAALLYPFGISSPTFVAVLVLQSARLFCRIRDRRLLASAFGVTPRRNAIAAAVLAIEIVVLSLALR